MDYLIPLTSFAILLLQSHGKKESLKHNSFKIVRRRAVHLLSHVVRKWLVNRNLFVDSILHAKVGSNCERVQQEEAPETGSKTRNPDDGHPADIHREKAETGPSGCTMDIRRMSAWWPLFGLRVFHSGWQPLPFFWSAGIILRLPLVESSVAVQ